VIRAIQLVAAIFISLVCVMLSLVDIAPKNVLHPDALWQAIQRIPDTLVGIRTALSHARWGGFAAVCVLTIFGFWVRAIRWRFFVQGERRVPTGSLFSATMIGFMANDILPLRLGEFVRAWALGRRENLSKTTVFATIVVERVVDMITLLAIFGIALLLHPIPTTSVAGQWTDRGAKLLIVLSAALTVFLIAIERWPQLLERLLDLMATRIPGGAGARAAKMLRHFVDGLGLFRDVPRLLWVFLLSFVMFLVYALCLTVSMWALRIDVPWYGGLIMLVITAIGIMVPAAPGYIGTINFACVAGLALFSVGKQVAIPFSWFYWAGQWLPITVVGLWYLRREGLTIGALSRAQESGG
jgi:uncharacterized protein (TIRG00374 family)